MEIPLTENGYLLTLPSHDMGVGGQGGYLSLFLQGPYILYPTS